VPGAYQAACTEASRASPDRGDSGIETTEQDGVVGHRGGLDESLRCGGVAHGCPYRLTQWNTTGLRDLATQHDQRRVQHGDHGRESDRDAFGQRGQEWFPRRPGGDRRGHRVYRVTAGQAVLGRQLQHRLAADQVL
jgi:hypothetical protein